MRDRKKRPVLERVPADGTMAARSAERKTRHVPFRRQLFTVYTNPLQYETDGSPRKQTTKLPDLRPRLAFSGFHFPQALGCQTLLLLRARDLVFPYSLLDRLIGVGGLNVSDKHGRGGPDAGDSPLILSGRRGTLRHGTNIQADRVECEAAAPKRLEHVPFVSTRDML